MDAAVSSLRCASLGGGIAAVLLSGVVRNFLLKSTVLVLCRALRSLKLLSCRGALRFLYITRIFSRRIPFYQYSAYPVAGGSKQVSVW